MPLPLRFMRWGGGLKSALCDLVLQHASKMEQIEAAAGVLGKRVLVEVG